MAKIKISKTKKKIENRLIFDEPTSLIGYENKIKTKSEIEIEEQKEIQRKTMIIEKFTNYNLSISDTEIAEVKEQLGFMLDEDGTKFHLIFLKVMEFEKQRDNYKEIERIPKKSLVADIEIKTNNITFTKEEQKYNKELEENND